MLYKFLRKFFKKQKLKNLTFEEEIKLGLNPFFHGNNKVQNVTIGRWSYVSLNSIVFNAEIGSYCSIGPNVVIGYGDHPTNFLSTSPHVYMSEVIYPQSSIIERKNTYFRKVTIGNDVWIGANVYIKNGVNIGTGAVIGAGAVVLKDVNEYAVVAGVPARVIRKRFDENIIKLLIHSRWWEYEPTIIRNFKSELENPTEANVNLIINFLSTLGK